jgi:5-methylcytosine-specific restriction endonuclease McrA
MLKDNTMQEFMSGQTAVAADEGIKTSLKTRDNAQQCAVLWFEEILNRQLYLTLGYSSINQYAKIELGFSKSHTGDFLQLCRTFKKLPMVREKVESGELKYTTARVLAGVADEKNQEVWLDSALNKSRRELEKEVKLAKLEAADNSVGQQSLLPVPKNIKPAAVIPVRVNMTMSPIQFARYEKLWEQIRKQKNAASDKTEALLEILESHVAGNHGDRSTRVDLSPANKRPVQIHIHQCPECAKATVQTSRGELEISKVDLERAQCDCQVSEPNKRNTTSIPPATRRKVLAAARHKCQAPGCDHVRFLEIHHVIKRSKGGTNDPSNLQVLCSACHKLVHANSCRLSEFMVKSPSERYLSNDGLLCCGYSTI